MQNRKLRLHSEGDHKKDRQGDDNNSGAEVRWNWFGGGVKFKRMNGWVLVSIIGLLCISGTFVYALWVILRIVEAKS